MEMLEDTLSEEEKCEWQYAGVMIREAGLGLYGPTYRLTGFVVWYNFGVKLDVCWSLEKKTHYDLVGTMLGLNGESNTHNGAFINADPVEQIINFSKLCHAWGANFRGDIYAFRIVFSVSEAAEHAKRPVIVRIRSLAKLGKIK